MIHNLVFSFQQVAPVFLIVFLGLFLKEKRWINDSFVDTASKIVFRIALPALCFLEIAKTDFNTMFNGTIIAFGLVSTLVVFVLCWMLSLPLLSEGASRGSFIQGCFRSNYAIIGFAVVFNLFGQTGLAKAAALLAFVMPLYNVLAVIALTVPRHGGGVSLRKMALDIGTNPLIIAVLFAVPISFFRVPMHKVVTTTVNYLSSLTLPLALIGIGGALDIRSAKRRLKPAVTASLIKIFLTPLVFTPLAFLAGVRGENLGVLFILWACPAAIASFIMAKAMECDADLAADIVLITTLASVVTMALGIFVLKTAGLI